MAKFWCKNKLKRTCFAALCGATCLLLLASSKRLVSFVHNTHNTHRTDLSFVHNIHRTHLSSSQNRECGDDLANLLTGRWEQQPMTSEELRTINAFLRYDREELFGMPKGLERSDKQCGNVTFEPTLLHPNVYQWFRALCDVEGPTPCCFHNVCLNKTVEECACADCIDPRTPIHAEYALWRPTDPNCLPLAFSQRELCDLLDNGTIYFIGDSLVRHVHTAMLLTILNNDKTGAFSDTMPQDVREKCYGLYMFTEKVCRYHIARNVSACGGRVQIRFIEVEFNNEGRRVMEEVQQLKNKPRSLVFVGIGFHSMFNSLETFDSSMKPALDKMSAENWTWPVLVWASIHSFGMLRKPGIPLQSTEDVLRFNHETHQLLGRYANSTPLYIFDTYNMTKNVTSFDGQHFAAGVNKVKVNVLMNFIWRLKRKHKW